ncbi:MAG: GntR family transcriptional regulator [Immundisolibacterales bacterium]|nr:GntR family transcriptional regulator [Immundisolibacterales bacterium]
MEFSEPKGIYLQIADQIRERVVEGDWLPGERIPSIRELAVELGVNPNTVTKSYQRLTDRGIISSRRGLGYFVSDEARERALREMKDEFLRDELPRIVRTMQLLEIGPDELAGHFARNDR